MGVSLELDEQVFLQAHAGRGGADPVDAVDFLGDVANLNCGHSAILAPTAL